MYIYFQVQCEEKTLETYKVGHLISLLKFMIANLS